MNSTQNIARWSELKPETENSIVGVVEKPPGLPKRADDEPSNSDCYISFRLRDLDGSISTLNFFVPPDAVELLPQLNKGDAFLLRGVWYDQQRRLSMQSKFPWRWLRLRYGTYEFTTASSRLDNSHLPTINMNDEDQLLVMLYSEDILRVKTEGMKYE